GYFGARLSPDFFRVAFEKHFIELLSELLDVSLLHIYRNAIGSETLQLRHPITGYSVGAGKDAGVSQHIFDADGVAEILAIEINPADALDLNEFIPHKRDEPLI